LGDYLELTQGIVERIGYTPTLLALRRTSKLSQYESERLLYRFLYRSMTKEDGTKSFQFLSNIKQSPRWCVYSMVIQSSKNNKNNKTAFRISSTLLSL